MTWEGTRRWLLALLAASALLALLFAVRVPFGDNPDERAHLDYVRLLLQERGFVKFVPLSELPESSLSRDEAHQPPLYYLLAAGVYAATGGDPILVRLLSLLLQVGTVYVAFRAVRDLLQDRPEVAVGAAAFVALLPTAAQLGAAVSNDALTTLLCAAIFWRLGLLVTRGQDAKGSLLLGGLFGLGLLTKTTVLQLAPAMLLAYLLAVRAGKLTLARAAGRAAAAFGLGLLFALPWFVRNTNLYGDPLALSIYRLTGPNFSPALIQEQFGLTPADYVRSVAVRSFASFWYFLHPNLPIRPMAAFVGPPAGLVAVLLSALAGLFGLYRWWGRGAQAGPDDAPPADERRVAALFLCAVLLLVPFFARFVLTVFQAQGRYFHPVLLPVAVLTALGGAALLTRPDDRRRALAGALLVPAVLLVLCLLQWAGGGFLGGAPGAR